MRRLIYLFLLGILVVFYLKFQHPLGLSESTVSLVVFVLSALSLLPLATFVESAVEELSELLGQFLGGLLHTTFGNVAELVIGISILVATSRHQIVGGADIVRASIAGAVIRNSLLFLGLATLFGCWRNGKMKFEAEHASEYSTVFALAVIGLALPTMAQIVNHNFAGDVAVKISLILGVVLLLIYLAYVLFAIFRVAESAEIKAHRRAKKAQRARGGALLPSEALPLPGQSDVNALFAEERERAEQRLALEVGGGAAALAVAAVPTVVRQRIDPRGQRLEARRQERAERGEAERRLFGKHKVVRGLIAVLVLALATAGVVVMSEQFVGTIEEVAKSFLGGNELFVGLIVIPVIGGMVELNGAIGMARRNRMEITMAVTAGASIQMILLVAPVLVLVAALLGVNFSLVFQPLALLVFLASSFVFMLLGRDGESSLLEGSQLVTFWILVASTAFFLKS